MQQYLLQCEALNKTEKYHLIKFCFVYCNKTKKEKNINDKSNFLPIKNLKLDHHYASFTILIIVSNTQLLIDKG